MSDYSFQLYSAREFPPLTDTLKMLADAGYAQVEGYGGVYEDTGATRAALDATGLTMPSGHFSIHMLEEDEEKVCEIASALGITHIYCPYLDASERPQDAAGWVAFAKRLEALGERYGARGMTFGWHNHDFEFVALADGSIPMKLILDNAPNISWEADIAWIVRGGGDPLEWIEAYGGRLSAVHVKDIAPNGECEDEDGWADVGQGTMDWKKLIDTLKATPTQLFIMEHDKPSDATRFAQRSLEASQTW
ncbi:sugar phosphate isomerase/epimerase [Roseibium polysiphoniae]|uniref:Sugar phosphate isomerase/epimerase n=1 Tax=Roseibium polysiphoniae TaxID=2571221 RepID=A0A944GQE2_9HYPH|nr:sugar phosphate isomerase/epimerase [Roseibium polysiphoniae]MBS8259133.1 sugar phosphate isomerase/epimerase [Roseibium polysiphoniae]